MPFTIEDIRGIKSTIQSMKKKIDSIQMDKTGVNTNKGDYIFSLLKEAGVR